LGIRTTKGRVITVCLMLLILAGCISPAEGVSVFPPDTFSESDLIGTWKDFNEIYSEEHLILRSDHTFEHIFAFDSDRQFESDGTWEVVKETNGCTYLHLEGMRYFYQSVERAENGNRSTTGVTEGTPLRYWDECSNQLIEMPDKVIMTISSFPDFPRGLVLQHMTTERNTTDISLHLVSD
jgi:hypothetical protein